METNKNDTVSVEELSNVAKKAIKEPSFPPFDVMLGDYNQEVRYSSAYNDITLSKAHYSDAGVDLICPFSVLLGADSTELIDTGITVEIPEGYFGGIYSRSGLSANGIVVANGVGVIDSGYRGTIGVLLHNRNRDTVYQIQRGDKIAQLIIQPYTSCRFIKVDKINTDTDRGEGRFGSSGR